MNKLDYILAILLFFTVSTSSFASFPVERSEETTNHQVEEVTTATEADFTSPAAAVAGKSKGIALILWFALGTFAAHRWYAGTPVWANILFIITLGGLGIWAIIDLVRIITGDMKADGGWQADFF